MIIIKNSIELAKLVNKDKDLILYGEDVRIEFSPTKNELRDVRCDNIYLEDNVELYNFNGRDFNGRNLRCLDFNGRDIDGSDYSSDLSCRDFNGRDFNGRDFNGRNFKGRDFNGGSFDGKKISYYAFFNCYNFIKCTSWEKGRENASDPICLDGKLEVIPEKDKEVEDAIKLLKEKGKIKDGKILV